MRDRIALLLVAATSVTPLVGCGTTRALRHHTTRTVDSAMDVHRQQVLDNLARFVFDPHSLPSFCVATGGQSQITDRATGGLASLGLNSVIGFNTAGLKMEGYRDNRQQLNLQPINDPRKLELIRCAFQTAVANCGKGGVSGACPDCQRRFNSFYTGQERKSDGWSLETVLLTDPKTKKIEDAYDIFVPSESPDANLVKSVRGKVTSECLEPGCCRWFGTGSKKCVPASCECTYVGHYCGTYVWVEPGQGREQLARLTLAVLDYATREPASRPTKEVTLYRKVDSRGYEYPAKQSDANKVVKVRVNTDALGEQALAYPVDYRRIHAEPSLVDAAMQSLLKRLPSPDGERPVSETIETVPMGRPTTQRSRPVEAQGLDPIEGDTSLEILESVRTYDLQQKIERRLDADFD